MAEMGGAHRVLVMHADGASYRDEALRRFPHCAWRFCARAEELDDAIERFAPTVAFSLRSEAFSGERHRPIVDCPSLRWLQVGGSGFDHLEPIDRERLILTNAAGVLAPFLADTCMLALGALNFGLHRHLARKRRMLWSRTSFRALEGQRLALIGTGSIARAFAARARAAGLVVTALSRDPAASGAEEVFDAILPLDALEEVLESADFVSPHTPLTERTRGMIGRDQLRAMKPSAHVINTARGGVVDEAALFEALIEGRIAGAYLDVFEREPLPRDHGFWRLDNVILTPHCADRVVDWETRLARFFMKNLQRYIDGQSLLNKIAS